MFGTPKRSGIPRIPDTPSPIRQSPVKKEFTFDIIRDEITPIANERLSNFSKFIEEQSKGVERAKRFNFLDPCLQSSNFNFCTPSINDISRMEERDKEISSQLAKIRALTFALETEQSSIRRTLDKA